MKKAGIAFFIGLLVAACSLYSDLPEPARVKDWRTKTIPPSPQRGGGDPERGLAYLIDGDYIGSGLPYELVEKRFGDVQDTIFRREGLNQHSPYVLTVFEAENGQLVGNGNCFTCHAGELNGEMVVGLGNSWSDYKRDWSTMAQVLDLGVSLKYRKDDPEYQAYQPFGNIFRRMTPYIETAQRGVNPAAMLAEACARHRDPQTLEFVEKPNFDMPQYAIATDVPPLWNVRKKHALYYTAVGRGDFTKLLFQASVLGIPDSAAARRVVDHFVDVVAWLNQLQPPVYPRTIDGPAAAKGKKLFNEYCSDCHGTYGAEETYPNKVVALDLIKTDPLYASYSLDAPIVQWYNESWFATSDPPSRLEPEAGYIAPPLDGIWATAPYLHNGSVPTLEALLDSPRRPEAWSRSGDSHEYDFDKVGWKYEEGKRGKWAYDTTLPGMGNGGHTFGDQLSDTERRYVIEYLKTL